MTKTLIATIGLFLFLSGCGLQEKQKKDKRDRRVVVETDGTDWFNLSPGEGAEGLSANLAHRAATTLSKNPVIVAVIDSGVDINHEDLQGRIWTNTKEIPNNGIDDDANGYIDDVNGWNYLVDRNGNEIDCTTLEMTREYRRLSLQTNSGQVFRNKAEKAYFNRVESTYNATKAEYANYEVSCDGYFNLTFDQRDNVAANFSLLSSDAETIYGNGNVLDDHGHGTHVSGIIAADRFNNIGIKGIAPNNIKIMPLKAIPDGDEYDRDVAFAIRYAADNGAKVINMSFGKNFSVAPESVLEALEYAAAKDLSIVSAAGNEAENISESVFYPNRNIRASDRLKNAWIITGASSPTQNLNLPALFSNYSQQDVDIFAPGYKILSTVPGNQYASFSGTSMASPAIAGMVALIRSVYPKLNNVQVKNMIINQGRTYKNLEVTLPGSKNRDDNGAGTKVDFGLLSRSGAVADVYNVLAAYRGQSGVHWK